MGKAREADLPGLCITTISVCFTAPVTTCARLFLLIAPLSGPTPSARVTSPLVAAPSPSHPIHRVTAVIAIIERPPIPFSAHEDRIGPMLVPAIGQRRPRIESLMDTETRGTKPEIGSNTTTDFVSSLLFGLRHHVCSGRTQYDRNCSKPNQMTHIHLHACLSTIPLARR
jgi:hypothetical protein